MSTIPNVSFIELFTPKLVTVFREGYRLGHLRADAVAGMTVAIVALPLSMAIAIASGASPDRGLYAAIVGGFFVSLLGGSRFQIGGPAGAFIVLVAATVQRHGIDGLLLATILAGAIMIAVGLFRLGTYIKFIPYPVTVGFTAGIAVIIFASQIRDLFGLTLAAPEPGPILDKIPALFHAWPSVNPAAAGVALATILMIVGCKRLHAALPGMLIAVAIASVAAAVLNLPVETIGSRFGGIPRTLPLPSLPDITPAKLHAVLPDALAFALLGAIESLLSAVVADGMTGRRHRSNCELVGQGVANVASGLFGGICVTGTIARTATNVRSGARGPVAGIMHAIFLLLFMLLAAPLADYIPLAALAGVLAVVAWSMAEKHAFLTIVRTGSGDALVLLATFALTVFRDLIEGIVVGVTLGSILFIDRMAKVANIETHAPLVPADQADGRGEKPYDPAQAADSDIVVYRITGAFFFAAASTIGSVLDRIADTHRAFIVDFSAASFVDSTAAKTIEAMAHKARRHGVKLLITGTTSEIRRELFVNGVKPPLATYKQTIADGLKAARRETANA
jgi:SulP family sulfate permease